MAQEFVGLLIILEFTQEWVISYIGLKITWRNQLLLIVIGLLGVIGHHVHKHVVPELEKDQDKLKQLLKMTDHL